MKNWVNWFLKVAAFKINETCLALAGNCKLVVIVLISIDNLRG